MKNPLISVIVPVYNVEKYLDRCMNSIVNQTYKNLEIILIDDGSTDKCSEMCDVWACKDSRVRIIHQKNGGASSARNAGMRLAVGDYIGFVDSDDWIENDMYEYLYKLIESNNVEVSFCDFRQLKDIKPLNKKNENILVLQGEDLDRYYYRINGEKSSYAVWCGLYKKEKIKDISFIEGEINEDVLFRYEVYKRVRKVAFSNLCKYNYFINSSGITNGKLSKKDYSLFKIWDYILNEEKNTSNHQYAIINRARATYTLYVKGLLYGKKDIGQDTLDEWQREIRDNYKLLMRGRILDWKRKILLIYIVIASH